MRVIDTTASANLIIAAANTSAGVVRVERAASTTPQVERHGLSLTATPEEVEQWLLQRNYDAYAAWVDDSGEDYAEASLAFAVEAWETQAEE